MKGYELDKLAELVHPDLDEAIERELEHIASEYGLNEELVTIAWETWVLKRANQVEG